MRTVYKFHVETLSLKNANRFFEFYKSRSEAGQSAEDIVETWNRFAQFPEDTVFLECLNKPTE